MLGEVLRRRFAHTSGKKDGEGWALPDLVLIDGGKGQLSSAREAMEEAGAQAIATLGLAKENEEIFLPGRSKPINLPVTSPGAATAPAGEGRGAPLRNRLPQEYTQERGVHLRAG